jgi:hypothetical protein
MVAKKLMTNDKHVSKRAINIIQLINEIAEKKYKDKNKAEAESVIKGLKYLLELKKK